MVDVIFERATGLSKDIRGARRTGQLKQMATEFIRLLESVPDCRASEVTAVPLDRMTTEADRVIETIEHWIEAGRVDGTDEQQLASAVYEIRDAIEQIHHWRRHYLGA
jgi:hypothetical protein